MSLFTMKKYITLIAGILVSTHSYAESYVFGGRAHFQGVLINQSCSILIENNAAVSIKTPNSPIQINFSLCPVSIYDNLAIGLSEQNKPTHEMFYTDPKARNDFDINQELNIQSLEQTGLDQKFIRQIDRPERYDSFAKNRIGILLNQTSEKSSAQASNILISVFYP